MSFPITVLLNWKKKLSSDCVCCSSRRCFWANEKVKFFIDFYVDTFCMQSALPLLFRSANFCLLRRSQNSNIKSNMWFCLFLKKDEAVQKICMWWNFNTLWNSIIKESYFRAKTSCYDCDEWNVKNKIRRICQNSW